MSLDDSADHLMRLGLRRAALNTTIINHPVRKHQVVEALFILWLDSEPFLPTNGNEIPTFESASVLPVRTWSTAKDHKDTANKEP